MDPKHPHVLMKKVHYIDYFEKENAISFALPKDKWYKYQYIWMIKKVEHFVKQTFCSRMDDIT